MRAPAVTPLIEAQGLVKSFPVARGAARRLFGGAGARRVVLAGADLAIMPGEAVGLVGASGVGKTTLARLLARLIEPDAGELRLDGRSMLALSPSAFARAPERRLVQMSFQDPSDSLAPHLSIAESIGDPALTLLPGEGAEARRARVRRAAARAGLGHDLLDRRPGHLSDGQKARAGLARALVAEPALLILDEPTAALDAITAAGVLRTLGALRGDGGVALLLVSHDRDAVRLLCNRAVELIDGRLRPAT